MGISPRAMRSLMIDGVRWFWRGADLYDLDQLVVLREDRRTMVWARLGLNPRVRIERRPKSESDGVFALPDLPALMELGPGAAAALARWAEGDAVKQRLGAAPPAELSPEWKQCRGEGRYWYKPEGADEGEELVRAVIEERLQRPVIAPLLRGIEDELGPKQSEQLARECAEALVARGVLDEPWARSDTRRVAVDELRIRDDAPWAFRSLRALWALAKAPRAVLEAERLAREYERAYRETVSGDRLERELAALCWVVVEHPYVAQLPVRHQAGGPMFYGPMHEWWRETVDLVTDEHRALLEWPSPARPLLAYHANASAQSPLLELPWQHIEERVVWRAMADAGLSFRAGAMMEESGVHARWHGRALREAPSMAEASASIARAGFALWTAMPWRMVLIATVQS